MTTSTPGAHVEIVGVSKRYGEAAPAVDRLDLDIRGGEFLTLLGPSGSGKTTTLNMVAGFVDPSEGEIRMDGSLLSGQPPHRRNIGMVFQQYALFPHMTVASNVGYPLRQRGVPKAERAKIVAEALAQVEMTPFADRLPKALSGGQQQRVAVARATVFKPRLLLMDEPLGALDAKLRAALQLGFKQLHRELGITMVYVTHDQEEALVMSDRIAVFNEGRIEQIGDAAELYERPSSRFVANFLGQSNLFDGTMSHDGGDTVMAGKDLRLVAKRCDLDVGSRATLLVRPERTTFTTTPETAPGNVMGGRVRDIVYLGSLSKIIVDLDAGLTWTVSMPASHGSAPRPGEHVHVTFPRECARVVPERSHLGVPIATGGATAPAGRQLAGARPASP